MSRGHRRGPRRGRASHRKATVRPFADTGKIERGVAGHREGRPHSCRRHRRDREKGSTGYREGHRETGRVARPPARPKRHSARRHKATAGRSRTRKRPGMRSARRRRGPHFCRRRRRCRERGHKPHWSGVMGTGTSEGAQRGAAGARAPTPEPPRSGWSSRWRRLFPDGCVGRSIEGNRRRLFRSYRI